MPVRGLFVDANLLVLLVVGSTDTRLITKHRRLQTFEPEDYEHLRAMVFRANCVLVTPNTLTEASNLLGQHGEPERSRFFDTLKSLIELSKEIVVTSADASRNSHFHRLGLTDAALLEAVSGDAPLVTVDLDLYLAAAAKDPNCAVNYRHLQNSP